MPEFPAMMYKADGSMLHWDGAWFDTLIVAREEEYKKALAEGWSIGKPSAEPVAEQPEQKRRGRPPKAVL